MVYDKTASNLMGGDCFHGVFPSLIVGYYYEFGPVFTLSPSQYTYLLIPANTQHIN